MGQPMGVQIPLSAPNLAKQGLILKPRRTGAVEGPMMKQKAWSVYIVECKDGRLYTGISNNVKKRIADHNKGRGCRFTKCRYPVELVYQEKCVTKSTARKRELEIQGFTRGKKLSLISES